MYCCCLIKSDAHFPRFNLASQARYLDITTIMGFTCLDMEMYFTMVAAVMMDLGVGLQRDVC